MIARRERLQYGCLFVTDLVSLVLSVGVSWLIMDGLFGKMVDFRQPYQFLEGFLMLFIAYILTFFVFDQSENIVTRDEMREAELAVGFNALLALLDVACLALTKASMAPSQMAICSFVSRNSRISSQPPSRIVMTRTVSSWSTPVR